MGDYHIERLNDNNAIKWEEFNYNSNEGTFFHTLKWKQIFEKTSNCKTHFFLLFKNNSVIGIFPFFEQKFRLFEGLYPFPSTGHNNLIIRDINDPYVIQYTLKELPKLMKTQKKISFIYFASLHKETLDNLKIDSIFTENYGNMILNLQSSPPNKLWENFSTKKGQRKYIRRFDETGYRTTEINSYDGLKLFYKYYLENINFIEGQPPTFSHFTDLLNNLSSDEMRITLLSKDSTVAGGLLMFLYKPTKTVYFKYLSLNRNLPNFYHPSYYLWWEGINWAWNNKYERVSFGMQQLDDNNPHYRIKKDLGAEFEPIYSKIISLTKTFTIGYKSKQFIDRLHLFN
jgi:hypothetical protein